MTSETPAEFDIAIIGMGVRCAAHMTLQAIEVLSFCKKGFAVLPDQRMADEFAGMLATRRPSGVAIPPIISLSPSYLQDRLRYENYKDAANTVLHSAQVLRPVAYLTPGNPVSFDSVAQEILRGAFEAKLRTVVIPGISSLDTIMTDLHREVAPGLQIYEASWAVGMCIRPDIRLACVLIQTTAFGTHYPVIGRKPTRNSLAVLKDYLLQFYPKEHIITFVRSGTSWSDPASIHSLPLHALDDVPVTAQIGASLFIPPAQPATMSQTFDEKMSSAYILDVLYPKLPEVLDKR